MKLIDRTPLQNEKGEIGIIQRIQGTLRYGFNWYSEIEAQRYVLARLQRGLAKGYVAVRNHTLGASGIVVPIALVGPAGIFAIYATHLRGEYQAKGDSWGTISGTTFKPASINLVKRTELLSRALQAFIERQGVTLPKPVEPVILAANPGMHVESVRPLTRVVMADAIERWASSLGKGAPVLTVETAYELADRIINPRKPKEEREPEEAPPTPQPEPVPQAEEEQELSRAGAIFAASEEAEPLAPNDLDFALEESDEREIPPHLIETSPSAPVPDLGGAKKRYLGMTIGQLALLAGMLLVEICVLIGFVVILFQNS